jgi:uncharacterized protein HemX
VSDTPTGVEREAYRETAPVEVRRSGAAGWWIAAVVAIIAVVGLVFVFTSQNRQDELQAARAQGAAQASLDAASNDAQRAAMQASQAAQTAVDSSARATQRAAEAAQTAADQTSQQVQQSADNAGQAARDAAATAPQ